MPGDGGDAMASMIVLFAEALVLALLLVGALLWLFFLRQSRPPARRSAPYPPVAGRRLTLPSEPAPGLRGGRLGHRQGRAHPEEEVPVTGPVGHAGREHAVLRSP